MVLASVIAGASGGALANVALSPLGGGAGMIQSYWYGAGLILGERDMYTFHWEKIKKRLEAGEDYLSVLESEMNPAITAIAAYSLEIMQKTGEIYIKGGIDFMAQLIENLFKVLAGETITPPQIQPQPSPCPPGFTKDANGICQPDPVTTPSCPPGFRWSASAQQCVPEDIPEPTPVPTPEPTPVPTPEPTPSNLTQAEIIEFSVGKIRTATSHGKRVYSVWSRTNPNKPASDGFNWTKLSGNFNEFNIAHEFALSIWRKAFFIRFEYQTNLGQEWYYVPRTLIGLPEL